MILSSLTTQVSAMVNRVNAMILLAEGAGGAAAFLDTAITWASAGVSAFGGGFIISGIIDLGEGNSQQNAAKKNEGISKIVGGIMVILVGIVLVPQIRSIFPQ